MRCLTTHEVSEWLRERAIPQDPYHQGKAPTYYLQFHAPVRHRQSDAFVRHYFERIIRESESLIHMTDWGLYQPSEMIAITGIRHSFGEKRILIHAPGYTLDPGEAEVGICLFSLSVSFGWSSYLYSLNKRSTLYNWEGDIFDFWTDNHSALAEMKTLLKQFNLTETIKTEQADEGNRRSTDA